MEINVYGSIQQPKVISTTSTDDWFDLIKDSVFKTEILTARNDKSVYDSVKSSIPCVTYNFLYKDYKKDINLIAPTGVMYIDIDNPLFDPKNLDTSKVYSYYHSFGGVGYSLLVKVNGLTKDNFRLTYLNICEELDILNFIDTNAVKPSQFNVLSYDENIFINHNSKIFDSLNFAPHTSVIRKKEESIYGSVGGKIRFDDLDEYVKDIEDDYVVNWEGFQYVNCWIPIKKKNTRRNNTLLSYTNNLVWLNPNISKEKCMLILKKVNAIAFVNPVSDANIKRVVDSIFTYKRGGLLQPIYFKKPRKIIFQKTSKLTKEEKFNCVNKELSKKKSNDSRQKIYDILESWDFKNLGKIAQRKVYNNFSISQKTVEKYWNEFKKYVKELNSDYTKEVMNNGL